jgi:hypothetical protein
LICPSGAAVTVKVMARVEFVPERTADGTIVLRAVVRDPLERLRRLVRRLLPHPA